MQKKRAPTCLWMTLPMWLTAACSESVVHPSETASRDCLAVVQTTRGPVRGDALGQACAWRGIAFAQPPVGDLRFAPPHTPEPWDTAIDGKLYRSDCEQGEGFLAGRDPDEDCLYLNVYASTEVPKDPADRRPVMVFIYGGGFVSGGASSPLYAGDQLAAHGVVVVTINYRLGPLGYLASEQLQADQGVDNLGNMGLLDQIAALQWVQDEIAAFGGDPGNVTIFGESAGAISVCALVNAPGAHGLFHAAIIESGFCSAGSRAEIGAKADSWIASTGCDVSSPSTSECLHALDLTQMARDYPYSMQSGNYPAVDGSTLPLQPMESMRQGRAAPVPMIIGYNHDEVKVAGLVPEFWRIREQSFAQFYAENSTIFTSAELATLRALYPAADYANPLEMGVDIIDDIAFACQAQDAAMAMASHDHPVYVYEFGLGKNAFALEPYVGSFHGLEIPFVFGTYDIIGTFYSDRRGVEQMLELSQRMQRYWTRFAATHDPNGGADLTWPQFAPQDAVLLLTPTPAVATRYRTERCEFWRSRAPEAFGERLDYISHIATQGRGGLPGFE